jgi:hypothetical protein
MLLVERRTTRAAVALAAAAVLAAAVSACGGNHKQRLQRAAAETPAAASDSAHRDADEVLSLTGLGRLEGRCPRGARSWVLRFVDDAGAGDAVSYRVGTGARRTVVVDAGKSITVRLVPNATKTHEPAFVVPKGQPRGRTAATSVATTEPLRALVYQATEPQTLRADVELALTTIAGESGRCVLVGSTVRAYTYPNQR